MNNSYLIAKRVMRISLLFVLILFFAACSKIDQKTAEKLQYWDKQVEIMTLVGPDKSSAFAWVYALDKNALYNGDSLHAVIEKLDAKNEKCIKLTINFDERERIREHIVFLDDEC